MTGPRRARDGEYGGGGRYGGAEPYEHRGWTPGLGTDDQGADGVAAESADSRAAFEDPAALEAAVGMLHDPLNDPLPGGTSLGPAPGRAPADRITSPSADRVPGPSVGPPVGPSPDPLQGRTPSGPPRRAASPTQYGGPTATPSGRPVPPARGSRPGAQADPGAQPRQMAYPGAPQGSGPQVPPRDAHPSPWFRAPGNATDQLHPAEDGSPAAGRNAPGATVRSAAPSTGTGTVDPVTPTPRPGATGTPGAPRTPGTPVPGGRAYRRRAAAANAAQAPPGSPRAAGAPAAKSPRPSEGPEGVQESAAATAQDPVEPRTEAAERTAAGRRHEETIALRVSGLRRRTASAVQDAVGGRAERRRAAKRNARGVRGGSAGAATGTADGAGADDKDTDEPAKPLSRVEARRAAKAVKPSPSVIASRVVGETFITLGVVMLLFVTYQLWWTNIRAQQQANGARDNLRADWAKGDRKPGAFEPGQGFAIMHIPKLDVVVPIAEGISKSKVLDRGMVGHYDKDTIPTAMPEKKTGNFGVAGHRNTHGEPFRYINRLEPGDPIVVETQDTYFVYKMASILPETSPRNTAVLRPIPEGSGFTEPGRYITLTTCTPEFTSTYRMIVWGKFSEERPRSEGKPDALL